MFRILRQICRELPEELSEVEVEHQYSIVLPPPVPNSILNGDCDLAGTAVDSCMSYLVLCFYTAMLAT
jgi:hypothetical protein